MRSLERAPGARGVRGAPVAGERPAMHVACEIIVSCNVSLSELCYGVAPSLSRAPVTVTAALLCVAPPWPARA